MGIVASGDPAITGAYAAAEGMRRLVEPAGGEAKAYRRRRGLAEDLLAVNGVIAFEDLPWRPATRRHNGADQRHEFLAQGGKGLRDFLGSRAKFVFVEQSIISDILVADRRGFKAFEMDNLVQPGQERSEVAGLPRLLPDLLGLRRHSSQFLDQLLGQLDRSVVAATNLTHIGGSRGFAVFDQQGALD